MASDPRHSAFRRAIEEAAREVEGTAAGFQHNYPEEAKSIRIALRRVLNIPNPFPEEAEPSADEDFEPFSLVPHETRHIKATIGKTRIAEFHLVPEEAEPQESARLREAIESAIQDIDVCNWRCLICGTDPKMRDTDLADTLRRALSPAQDETAAPGHTDLMVTPESIDAFPAQDETEEKRHRAYCQAGSIGIECICETGTYSSAPEPAGEEKERPFPADWVAVSNADLLALRARLSELEGAMQRMLTTHGCSVVQPMGCKDCDEVRAALNSSGEGK